MSNKLASINLSNLSWLFKNFLGTHLFTLQTTISCNIFQRISSIRNRKTLWLNPPWNNKYTIISPPYWTNRTWSWYLFIIWCFKWTCLILIWWCTFLLFTLWNILFFYVLITFHNLLFFYLLFRFISSYIMNLFILNTWVFLYGGFVYQLCITN